MFKKDFLTLKFFLSGNSFDNDENGHGRRRAPIEYEGRSRDGKEPDVDMLKRVNGVLSNVEDGDLSSVEDGNLSDVEDGDLIKTGNGADIQDGDVSEDEGGDLKVRK